MLQPAEALPLWRALGAGPAPFEPENVTGAPFILREAEAASRILIISSPSTATRYRLRIRFDAINKMLAGQLQRFFLLDVRDVAVPVMIRVLKFSERVVVRRTLYPCIVDADLFPCPQIVIYDHASRADDRHFANFPRLEPAALNGHEALVREGERHVCHVLHARRNMSVSLAVNRGGKFVKNMENDRDVVRRQVPGDIDVLLE